MYQNFKEKNSMVSCNNCLQNELWLDYLNLPINTNDTCIQNKIDITKMQVYDLIDTAKFGSTTEIKNIFINNSELDFSMRSNQKTCRSKNSFRENISSPLSSILGNTLQKKSPCTCITNDSHAVNEVIKEKRVVASEDLHDQKRMKHTKASFLYEQDTTGISKFLSNRQSLGNDYYLYNSDKFPCDKNDSLASSKIKEISNFQFIKNLNHIENDQETINKSKFIEKFLMMKNDSPSSMPAGDMNYLYVENYHNIGKNTHGISDNVFVSKPVINKAKCNIDYSFINKITTSSTCSNISSIIVHETQPKRTKCIVSKLADPSTMILTALIVKWLSSNTVNSKAVEILKRVCNFLPRALLSGYSLFKNVMSSTDFMVSFENIKNIFFTCCLICQKFQKDQNTQNINEIKHFNMSISEINYLERTILNAVDFNINFSDDELFKSILEIKEMCSLVVNKSTRIK